MQKNAALGVFFKKCDLKIWQRVRSNEPIIVNDYKWYLSLPGTYKVTMTTPNKVRDLC